MRFLAFILATLTRTPRYFPDIKWSADSWTHNTFRFYELLFGRRVGIRAEVSARYWRDERGTHVAYAAHSWEACFALAEQYTREFLASPKIVPFRIYIPIFQTPQGLPLFAPPYIFAIANDNSHLELNSGSPASFSFTCTGSNLKLYDGNVGAVQASPDNITAVSYNSVSLTQGGITTPFVQVSGDRLIDLWYLDGPSTGSHTIAITFTSYCAAMVTSYSGCATGLDSNHTTTQTANTSLTASTTVIAANSWLIGPMRNANAAESAGTGTTLRVSDSSDAAAFCDSNATVGTGSQSLQVTWTGSQTSAAIIVSQAPFIALVTVYPLFASQAVKRASFF